MGLLLSNYIFASTDPVLFFGKSDVSLLKQRIKESGEYSTLWKDIVKEADSYCTPGSSAYADPAFFSNEDAGGQWGHQFPRQLSQWLESIGFAYIMTNDRRYARHGIELMMVAVEKLPVSNPAMSGPMAGTRGDMMRAMAFGLDFLSEELMPEQRAEAAKFSRDYILYHIAEYDNPDSWWRKYHNFNGVCGGSSGMLAITLRDDYPDEADKWISHSKNTVTAWLNDGFDAKGAYFEGILYSGYGLGNVVIFADALNRYAGDNSILLNEHLNQVPYFLAMSLLPGEPAYDARNDSLYRYDLGGRGTGCPFLLRLAKGVDGANEPNRLAAWLWKQTGSRYQKFLQIVWGNDVEPADPASLIKKPYATHFEDLGLCIWRSGWEKDDVMFSVEAGPYYPITHNQADKGHFTLYGLGYRWAADAGYGNNKTSETSRCTTAAHSCVLIDGKGQALSGAGLGTDGKIMQYENTPDYGYALIDAKSAYNTNNKGQVGVAVSKALRHTFFVRPDGGVPAYAVVLDDIEVDAEEHEFTWQLITWNDMTAAFEGNTAIVTPPGAAETPRMKVVLNSSQPANFSSDVYEPNDGAGREPTTFLRIKAKTNAVNPRFAAVLLPLPAGMAEPEVEFKQQAHQFEIKIKWKTREDKIVWDETANFFR